MFETKAQGTGPESAAGEAVSATDSGDTGADDGGGATRRSFIRAASGAAVAAGGAAVASGETAAQSRTYRFGGHVEAWEGREPESIAGESNPTLQLEAGTEYEVVWENLDGVIHNFVIQSADGRELAATEDVTQEGATASVTFTATAEVARYICIYHQSTMVGDIEVEGGAGAATGDGASEGRADTDGVPLEVAAIAGAVAMMFLSPFLFALFLLARRQTRGEQRGAPNR